MYRHIFGKLTLGAFLIAVAGSPLQAEEDLQIAFTKVAMQGAGPDSRGQIAGTVSGLKEPQKYKVVIYANAGLWYVQPTVEEPFTDIASDGSWKNWTHLGNRYAALVVRPSFRPPRNPGKLPGVGGDVIGLAEVEAKEYR